LLEIRCLNCAQLQIQKRRQTRSDPGMNPAGVYIRDQPRHRVPHRERIVQGRQRISGFASAMTIAPAPDAGRPMELEALVGAVVELGERVGLPMTCTRTVYNCTRLLMQCATRQAAT